MNEATSILLEQFQALEWFHSCGKPAAADEIVFVAKSLDAVGHVTSGYLEVIGYQNGVAMENAVVKSARGMKKRWKEAEAELRPLARTIVKENLQPLRERREWPIQVDMIGDYDISYALLEQEFLEIVGSGLFGLKAHWYLQGRLPCGADDEGRLIVY